MNSIEETIRKNAEAAKAAHKEGRHGPGASPEDRATWARMGCTECLVYVKAQGRRL